MFCIASSLHCLSNRHASLNNQARSLIASDEFHGPWSLICRQLTAKFAELDRDREWSGVEWGSSSFRSFSIMVHGAE